jgi:cysteinyl-tRNA synthetase
MVEFDNMDWAFDDAYQSEYGFGAEPADAIAYHQTLCDHTHSKGMGCMAKNTRQGAAGFDGGTFESYNDDLDWWETAHLVGFLNDGKLGIIVHYDETDCDGTYDDYKVTYGADLSYICEDRATEKYRHYN